MCTYLPNTTASGFPSHNVLRNRKGGNLFDKRNIRSLMLLFALVLKLVAKKKIRQYKVDQYKFYSIFMFLRFVVVVVDFPFNNVALALALSISLSLLCLFAFSACYALAQYLCVSYRIFLQLQMF